MVQFLDDNPEYIICNLLDDNWGTVAPTDAGYTGVFNANDPLGANDFPISTSWNAGDSYPILTITNNDPTVPGGGNTNVTGLQGDGSGQNQRRLETMLMTVQAAEGDDYNNNLEAHELVEVLYNHAFQILFEVTSADYNGIWDVYVTPGTHSPVETDSTAPTHQYQGNVTIDWNKEP